MAATSPLGARRTVAALLILTTLVPTRSSASE
jgi:hypothetical protein